MARMRILIRVDVAWIGRAGGLQLEDLAFPKQVSLIQDMQFQDHLSSQSLLGPNIYSLNSSRKKLVSLLEFETHLIIPEPSHELIISPISLVLEDMHILPNTPNNDFPRSSDFNTSKFIRSIQ